MSEQSSSSIYFQFIDGNSRVHNGNTYAGSVSGHDYIQRGGQLNGSIGNNYSREELSPKECRSRLLRALSYDQIHTHRQNLREPSPNTCTWILHTPQYRAWIDPREYQAHHGFFWIKGKPGAGKSILMNYLLTVSLSSVPTAIAISFFFNARGHELERTIMGLYRSLLSQLIRKFPSIDGIFSELSFEDPEPIEQHGWQVQSLKNLLSRAISKLAAHKFVFYIDALDECPEEQVRDMVLFFQEIGDLAIERGNPSYVCLSSRHYPNISINRCVHLNIENQHGHRTDLERYIDSTLAIDSSGSMGDIKHRILDKASGVFLWVALVIPMLNKAFDSGRVCALREQLEKLPSQLSLLFRDMLIRDSEDQNAMLLCIQLVLFTRRQLSLPELYSAIQVGLGYSLEQPDSLSVETMYRYILSSSKGLVEGICYHNQLSMQFIHESVRDFLLHGNELQSLWPHLKGNLVGESHEQIKQLCFKLIQSLMPLMGAVNTYHPSLLGEGFYFSSEYDACMYMDELTAKYPFIEYAVLNVLHHSNEAQFFEVQQLDWIQAFPVVHWITLYNMILTNGCCSDADMYMPDVKMLYVLAHQNMVHLIRKSPDRPHHLKIKGGYYGTPLVAALARGCREVARDLGLQVFLDQGLDITHGEQGEAFFSRLKPLDRFQPRGLSTFGCLSWFGCVTAMRAMQLQGENIEQFDDDGRTPLSHAISNMSVESVGWLCSHKDLNPNVVVHRGLTTLLYICDNYTRSHQNLVERKYDMKRYISMLHILLQHPKIEVDHRDEEGRTPFSRAAGSQLFKIADMLLKTGSVDVNSRCRYGKTPLHYATSSCEPESLKMVTWLLSIDAVEPNYGDNFGSSPLSYAVAMGSTTRVKALLTSEKVNVDCKDKEGRSPLLWAIIGLPGEWYLAPRLLRIVRNLLQTGRADPDSTTARFWTPLTLARHKLNVVRSSISKRYMESCIEMIERYKGGDNLEYIHINSLGVLTSGDPHNGIT